MIGRVCRFVAVFAALQFSWQFAGDAGVGRSLIALGVVAPAAALIQAWSPAAGVTALDDLLQAPGGGVRIVNGCDGTDALFLLIAGLCAAPLSVRRRLAAAALGVPLVYALNMLRVLTLFYARRAGPAQFDLWHGRLAPALMVLLVLAYFYAWMFRNARLPPRAA